MESTNIKQEFEKIYGEQVDSLFRYCSLRVGSRAQAVDIVQDVFTELWQTYQKGTVLENPRAFLFTVLRNRIIDWYRKKKALSLDAMMDKADGEHGFEPADHRADGDILLSAESKLVMEAIDMLEENYREVLYLRLIEDMTPQEIGSVLDINANTVSIRITRGLERLREKLNIKKNL